MSKEQDLTLRSCLVFAILFGAAGCVTRLEAPDLNNLYDRAAQHHDPWRNPIIVVPGLLGSKLVDSTSSQIVWGAFGGGAANPRRPDDARLIALPMEMGMPLSDLRDGVHPDGALDRIKIRLLGLPIELDAYFFILASLGAGGYRDELLGRLGAIDYGDDHFTCFQFDYDWRRDNVENAQRLHQFMIEKRAYVREEIKRRYGVDNPNVRFDVVSHSMGGLLVRYMLEFGDSDLPLDGSVPTITWAGAELVDRAILISPPNGGSALAVEQIIEGVQFSALFPRYEPALVGTFPSVYQLLPRARHVSVVDDATGQSLDPLDPEIWIRHQWGLANPAQDNVLKVLLPNVSTADERRAIALDHLRKSLARARQFQAALDQPASPPSGTELYLIAGDAVLTDATLAVDPVTSDLHVTDKQPGDGTILRSSALLDERPGSQWKPELVSPIPWRNVQFVYEDHLGITSNHEFTDNLLYLLLESPRGADAQIR